MVWQYWDFGEVGVVVSSEGEEKGCNRFLIFYS